MEQSPDKERFDNPEKDGPTHKQRTNAIYKQKDSEQYQRRRQEKYVKKGEEGQEQQPEQQTHEETQGDRRQNKKDYPKKPRDEHTKKEGEKEQKYVWDRSKITVDTVIPEVPKKDKLLTKPSEDELVKKLDDFDQKVQVVYDKKKKYFDNLFANNNKLKEAKTAGTQGIKHTLKDKQQEKKDKKDIFDQARSKFTELKKKLDNLNEEADLLKSKMKKQMSKDEIQNRLKELKHSLNNDLLSPAQEKILIKEVDELEKSLPHAIPLSNLQDQIKSLQKEKKQLSDAQNTAYNEMKVVDDALKQMYDELDQFKIEQDKQQSQLEPEIQAQKDKFNAQVEEIKKQKSACQQQYRDNLTKFYDQEDFIKYVDWMKRVKEKLVRDLQRQKKQEEYQARLDKKKEEQEKLEAMYDSNFYQAQIDQCDRLIKYCSQLNPQKQNVQTEEQKQDLIKSHEAQWQKEKVTLMKPKKERLDDDVLVAGGKKNKNKKHQKQQTTEEVKNTLDHHIEILASFNELKVDIPLNASELDKTIEKLQEKKNFFVAQPKPDKNKGNDSDNENQIRKLEKPVKRTYRFTDDLEDQSSYPTLQN